MFGGSLFHEGRFKEHQPSLNQMTATHFICIFKWHIAMVFSFHENKK